MTAAQALVDAEKALDELAENEKTLRKHLYALVMPITTEKKLTEVWPEGVKYMTPIDRTENLPALTSATVVALMEKFRAL